MSSAHSVLRACLLHLGLCTILAASELAVDDLVLDLPEDWRLAAEAPVGSEALAHGPDGAALAIVRRLEPQGLEAGAAAWIDQQVRILGELLPEAEVIARDREPHAGLEWTVIDYRFRHLETVWRQRAWLALRVDGGVTTAWVLTLAWPADHAEESLAAIRSAIAARRFRD